MLIKDLKKIKIVTLNFGPQHPAAHEVLRLLIEIVGERVIYAEELKETGQILFIKDDIARCSGLTNASFGEIVLLGIFKIQGSILKINKTLTCVLILSNEALIKVGDSVCFRSNMNIPLSINFFTIENNKWNLYLKMAKKFIFNYCYRCQKNLTSYIHFVKCTWLLLKWGFTVYVIRLKKNNRWYIGRSGQFTKRIKDHIREKEVEEILLLFSCPDKKSCKKIEYMIHSCIAHYYKVPVGKISHCGNNGFFATQDVVVKSAFTCTKKCRPLNNKELHFANLWLVQWHGLINIKYRFESNKE